MWFQNELFLFSSGCLVKLMNSDWCMLMIDSSPAEKEKSSWQQKVGFPVRSRNCVRKRARGLCRRDTETDITQERWSERVKKSQHTEHKHQQEVQSDVYLLAKVCKV